MDSLVVAAAKPKCATGRVLALAAKRLGECRMFIDARAVPTGTVIETEVCIVGAGAAGITRAREFVDASFRVILLESGGAKPDPATQELYDGSDIGRPY